MVLGHCGGPLVAWEVDLSHSRERLSGCAVRADPDVPAGAARLVHGALPGRDAVDVDPGGRMPPAHAAVLPQVVAGAPVDGGELVDPVLVDRVGHAMAPREGDVGSSV